MSVPGGDGLGWEGGGGLIASDIIDPVGPDGVARLLIPSIHEDLKTCIRQTRNGDTVYFQAVGPNYRTWDGGERGWHSWQGRCFVGNDGLWRKRNPFWPWSGSQTLEELRDFYTKAEDTGGIFKLETHKVEGTGWLRITGAPGVRVNGQLIVCQNTSGEVLGPMTLALLSDVNYAMEQCEINYVGGVKCTLTVQGQDWLVSACSVRASGGTAVRADAASHLRLQECAIGGVLAYDSDGRLCKASHALSAVYESKVEAVGCSIEHTEVHKHHLNGGSGIKLSGAARLVLEDSILHSHDGVGVEWSEFSERGRRQPNKAVLSIRNCILKPAGVALFAAKPGMEEAELSVVQSELHSAPPSSLLWANRARPGRLCELRDDVREVLVPASASEEQERAARVHAYHRALFQYLPKNPLTEDDQAHAEGVDLTELYDDSDGSGSSSSEEARADWPGPMEPEEVQRHRAVRIAEKLAKMRADGIQRPDRGMHYPPPE